jgi:adenylate cyclase
MVFDELLKIVSLRFELELPKNLYYHGLHHTVDVVAAVEELAKQENVSETNVAILKIAALFHDVGFCVMYDNNEQQGAKLAREGLKTLRASETQITEIEQIILSTRLHQEPQSHLEQIMSDADFDYFGREDFHQISETLRLELNEYGKNYSSKEWDIVQVDFLSKHRYYTATAKKMRLPKKMDNLTEVKNRLAAY